MFGSKSKIVRLDGQKDNIEETERKERERKSIEKKQEK